MIFDRNPRPTDECVGQFTVFWSEASPPDPTDRDQNIRNIVVAVAQSLGIGVEEQAERFYLHLNFRTTHNLFDAWKNTAEEAIPERDRYALQKSVQYPDMFKRYQEACAEEQARLGGRELVLVRGLSAVNSMRGSERWVARTDTRYVTVRPREGDGRRTRHIGRMGGYVTAMGGSQPYKNGPLSEDYYSMFFFLFPEEVLTLEDRPPKCVLRALVTAFRLMLRVEPAPNTLVFSEHGFVQWAGSSNNGGRRPLPPFMDDVPNDTKRFMDALYSRPDLVLPDRAALVLPTDDDVENLRFYPEGA